MRLRKTLTETLMLEDVAGEYETHWYDKTATAYMFGYACSSGFGGSGFSGGSGFRRGNRGNIFTVSPDGLTERYDFSGHNNLSPHLNQDLFGASKRFSKNALEDSHTIDLGFGLRTKKLW